MPPVRDNFKLVAGLSDGVFFGKDMKYSTLLSGSSDSSFDAAADSEASVTQASEGLRSRPEGRRA
jgi:hypothetical protein